MSQDKQEEKSLTQVVKEVVAATIKVCRNCDFYQSDDPKRTTNPERRGNGMCWMDGARVWARETCAYWKEKDRSHTKKRL